MSKFNFESLNNSFQFDLPDGLWSKENFIKAEDALGKYFDQEATGSSAYAVSEIVPIIAFGITKIDKEEHPDAVSDRSAWVATESEIINVPSWQLSKIEEILNNSDAVEACKNGEFGVQLVEYPSKYGKLTKIEFKNI